MTKLQPLAVDVYAGDGPKNWASFCAAGPPWHVAIFKCSQGTYYRPGAYVSERAKFLRSAGPDHFEGAYHYLDFGIDGAAQADYAVTSAGGRRDNTLPMMVDVERGGQRIQDPSRALVEERVRTFADRYYVLTGRRPTLYGGELLRSLGIADRLGCALSAVALYGARLAALGVPTTTAFLARTGTDLEHLLLWQYREAGGKSAVPDGYPTSAPGAGNVDISAVTLPGGIAALHALCKA
jgi:GH25 family lysozyme M1 (1,4-beta-N-acetylmuramidase)